MNDRTHDVMPKNYFGNVMDPSDQYAIAQCSPAAKKTLGPLTFNEWDIWKYQETDLQITLEQFIEVLHKKSSGLNCTMIVMSDLKPSKTIYADIFPTHAKRRKQCMRDLFGDEIVEASEFAVMSIFLETEEGEEELGPPLKYYFIK